MQAFKLQYLMYSSTLLRMEGFACQKKVVMHCAKMSTVACGPTRSIVDFAGLSCTVEADLVQALMGFDNAGNSSMRLCIGALGAE